MASKTIVAQEKEWQAQDDARILADASSIRRDKPRLKRAVSAAKKMSDEQNVRVRALKAVSRIKVKK